MPELPTGPWQDRVQFAPGGRFAFRPGEVLVRENVVDLAQNELQQRLRGEGGFAPEVRRDGLLAESFQRLSGAFDTLEAIAALDASGVPAQPNHVLFATCCCPPHPSRPDAEAFYAHPFYAHGLESRALGAHPFYAHPFYAHAGQAGCPCGCGSVAGAPFYAHASGAAPNPVNQPDTRVTGRRRSSARPAPPPELGDLKPAGAEPVRIAILDTGWAENHAPTGLPNINLVHRGGDQPDADGDRFLDPAAGHGTFIAGLIEREAPGCQLELASVLTSYGDGSEDDVAEVLRELARRPDEERPHLVNLSFGGYTPIGMAMLAHAVTELRRQGTIVVAAAGNDGSCAPLYPAAFPDVIGVGALDRNGNPAPFTNYGPWVRVSTNGVDLVSIFFDGFDGAEPPSPVGDDDNFTGWAVWSGTSFAAPRVVAALARELQAGADPEATVRALIDDPQRPRKPMLGLVL